jgi:hypothetical protein
VLWLLLTFAAPAVACPTTAVDVTRRAERALEDEATGQLPTLMADIDCLSDRMTVDGAAALHRLAAVEAFGRRDLRTVAIHLRATPTEGWTPSDPQLARIARSSHGTEARSHEALAPPTGWRALIDGRFSAVRPLDRSVVFQWVDAQGAVVRSAWLLPEDATPSPPLGPGDWLAPPPEVPGWASEPENKVLIGGIGAGVAAGSMLVAGLVARAGLPEPAGGPADPARAEQIRRQARTANVLGYTGQGLGVVAVGLVVTSRVAF